MKTSIVRSACTLVACLCGVLLPGAASAKTVALWPIEWNDGTQWIDARCRIDPANDLVAKDLEYRTNETPGTELPPNPAADVPEDFACNYISYFAKANSAQNQHYTSVGASRYMTLTNDVTVEFFFKVETLPAAGGVAILAGFNPEQNGTGDRWFASLHRTAANAGKDEFYWHIYGVGRSADINSDIRISAADAADYFSRWHHFAFVFDHDKGGGKNWTGLYVDGTLVCEGSQTVVTTYPTQKHTSDAVVFGGRAGSCRLSGSIDYIRISDEVLAPADFLIGGGGAWHRRANRRTVAYWPLDSKNGIVDGRNVLGGSPLQMLVNSRNQTGNYSFLRVRVSPSTHKAFAGDYPPNRNMTPAPTYDMPDNGSVRQQAAYGDAMQCTCLYDASVGTGLSLTNDFTFEGWFMPERRGAADIQLLFASDQSGNSRWHLNLWRTDADGWRLVLYAHDGTAAVQPDAVLATRADVAMDAWGGVWRHLALVHKADGGNGKGSWALYLDGSLVRTVEDVAKVSSTYKPIPGFTIGGRWNTANRAFVGCVDQVRVCRAALRPTQFLNAQADAETATDVLRYWPLNIQGGVGVDGRDATGQGVELAVPWSANQLPTSYASAPDVSNPDSSLAGCPSATGSTRFFDPNGSDKRDYSSLATFDAATLELYNSKRAMTLEYYYRSFRSAKCDNTRCLLCFIDVPYASSWTWRGHFNYRDADNARFHFQDQVYCNVASDTKLGDVSMVYDGEWHHVAIVRSPTETGFTYSFYQDGTACGTASSTFARETPNKAMALVVGGRWWNNANSMDGALASLRVTEGALTADEFLNATPAAPLGPVSIWNAKTATLPMTNLNVGAWAAYDTAFTFEMELTLPAAPATEVELFGAYATSPASGVTSWPGWRVFLRPDGNVRLEAACGANYGSYARGTFACDLTASFGERERLAIVYNPQEGDGVWRLYRNARLVGTLSNLFSPLGTTSAITGTAYLPRPFVLGAGVGGSARNIRFSRAVLTAGELLCSRGMTILVR